MNDDPISKQTIIKLELLINAITSRRYGHVDAPHIISGTVISFANTVGDEIEQFQIERIGYGYRLYYRPIKSMGDKIYSWYAEPQHFNCPDFHLMDSLIIRNYSDDDISFLFKDLVADLRIRVVV